jgi:hypothetical protein
LVKVKLEVLELNLEEEADVDVRILDGEEFVNPMLLLDWSKLELGVLVLDDKKLLLVPVVLVVTLDNAVVVLLAVLVVVVLELFFDEMGLDEYELVELVNRGLELAVGEGDDVIGIVVDEDEFSNLEMLVVELRLFEVLVPAAELVFTAVGRLVDALEEVLR